MVPNAQSLKMEEALRTAGKQVSLINVSGGVSPAAIRVQMLRAFDDFLRDSLQKPEAR